MVKRIVSLLLFISIYADVTSQNSEELLFNFSFKSTGDITANDFNYWEESPTTVEFVDTPSKEIIVYRLDEIRKYSIKHFEMLEDNFALFEVEWNEGVAPIPYTVLFAPDGSRIQFFSIDSNWVCSYSTHKYKYKNEGSECKHGRCTKIKSDGERCKNCCQEHTKFCWNHNK